jgi:carboxylesterase type B
VFGFPAAAEIPAGHANLGFLDQRKSLSWVQKNIAKFGGNPDKVLIFGESAGGYSVKQLVASPPAGKLPFHAAIMQSQASGVHGDPAVFAKLAKQLGCAAGKGELACVAAAPAAKIKDLIEHAGHQFGPVQDGVTHLTDVRDAFKAGKAAKVPMIIGTNADEGRPFAAIGLSNGGDVVDFFGAFLGDRDAAKAVIDNVKPLYPKDKFPNDMEFGSQLFTDIGFQCPNAILTKAIAGAGYTAYRYFYTAKYPEEDSFPDLRAYHSEEILNIFGTYKAEHKNLDRLGAVMQGIWTDFAKNPSAAPAGWPKLSPTSYQVRQFGNAADSTVDGDKLDAPRCAVIGPLSEASGI